jgi:hypothetical protein
MLVSPVLLALAASARSSFRSRVAMHVEILALRHQLGVYQRTCHRPRLRPADRVLWSWLSRAWPRWREALVLVQPQTVIAWRRRRFRRYWSMLSRAGSRPGRPAVAPEVRQLIRRLSTANPLWGAPRLVGELAKIGIDLALSTVARYMVRRRRPPSATWRAFLQNHAHRFLRRSASGTLHAWPCRGPRSLTGQRMAFSAPTGHEAHERGPEKGPILPVPTGTMGPGSAARRTAGPGTCRRR